MDIGRREIMPQCKHGQQRGISGFVAKVILFNLSGHGLIDMASYDQYLAGNLMNYELTPQVWEIEVVSKRTLNLKDTTA